MQLKYHVPKIQKVQLIAKSPKFGSSVQQVKGPLCVCGSGATSIVLSELKRNSVDLAIQK